MFASLVEGCIYDRLHDTALRQCLKQSKSAHDAVSYSTIDAALQRVHEVGMEVELGSSAEAAATAAKTADMIEVDDDDDEVVEKQFMDEETAEAHSRWMAVARSKAGLQ